MTKKESLIEFIGTIEQTQKLRVIERVVHTEDSQEIFSVNDIGYKTFSTTNSESTEVIADLFDDNLNGKYPGDTMTVKIIDWFTIEE